MSQFMKLAALALLLPAVLAKHTEASKGLYLTGHHHDHKTGVTGTGTGVISAPTGSPIYPNTTTVTNSFLATLSSVSSAGVNNALAVSTGASGAAASAAATGSAGCPSVVTVTAVQTVTTTLGSSPASAAAQSSAASAPYTMGNTTTSAFPTASAAGTGTLPSGTAPAISYGTAAASLAAPSATGSDDSADSADPSDTSSPTVVVETGTVSPVPYATAKARKMGRSRVIRKHL